MTNPALRATESTAAGSALSSLGTRAVAHGVDTAEQALVVVGRAVPAGQLGERWPVPTARPSSEPGPPPSVAGERVIGQQEPVRGVDSAGTQRPAGPAMGRLVAATASVLAVYALDIFFGVLPADLSALFQRFATSAVFFGAAGQCALRARARQSGASGWGLFALALVAWGGGSFYYGAVLWDAAVPPIPSPADGLWLVFYPFAYAALFLLLRDGLGTQRKRVGLDAAICAMAAAGALAAAILPTTIEHGGTTPAFLTSAAYPLGDLGLLAVLVAVMSVVGLKRSGSWPLVALAFAMFVLADSVYLVQVAHGTYRLGVVDLGWPLAALLLGGAAWRCDDGFRVEPKGSFSVALPATSGFLALGLLLYGEFRPLHIVGFVLAGATIIVVLLRLFQALRSNRRLADGLMRDLDERRRVSAVLRRNEARLRRTEEVVGCGSWELSLNGENMSWSDGFLRVYGLEPGAEPKLGTLTAAVHPDDRIAVRDAVSTCIASGRATVEHRIRRPDGGERTLIVEGELVAPSEDRAGYLQGGVLDVTDERAAFDAAPMGMLVAEPVRLRLLRVNDALCAMLARTREDLLGRSIEELTHPDDRTPIAGQRWALMDQSGGTHQAEKRYLRPDGSVVWAAIYVTPVHLADGSVKAFSSQVIDITEEKNRAVEIQTARVDSLRRLAVASEYRDNETHEHTERVGHLAGQIARTLGVTEARIDLLRQAAPLHDIGKVGVSDLILLKPGLLTPDERKAMERHTLIGADILAGSDSPVLQMAEEIALTHHERWDGEGYPHNLCGEDIPLFGRVVAIADVFDALTHARPYKDAWSVERAVAHIRDASGSQFDPYVVTAFNALDHASLSSFEPSSGGRAADTVRHTEPAGLPRSRGLHVAQDDERTADRDHAAADRDRAASVRDHTAAERDRSEAEADRRTSDRDNAASDRDSAASARDLIAVARDRSAARDDRQTAQREHAASDREDVASDRDHVATGRDETQAHADADQRSAESDPQQGDRRSRSTAARRQSAVNADQRTSDRGQAVDDRERAASDREQTASDRDQAQVEAGRRASSRDDAAADREHAEADSLRTASDRDHAQMEANQRLVNRDSAAADRALAAADRDQTAADRHAATIDRDEARERLRRAQSDQLTGALGRALGIITLGREINRARHGNGKLVLAFVDVDRLKEVNDLRGHATGDLLLKQVVEAMQSSLRSYDPIVRYGGDEFVCALVDATPADVERRFEEVRARLARVHPGATISVGLAALRPGDTLEHLTERGDAALYRAKRSAGADGRDAAYPPPT